MAKKAPVKKNAKASFTGTERLVVIYGDELFLQNQAMDDLKKAVSDAVNGDMDVLHFDGKSAELSDVMDEVRSYGLMQQYKLVIVDEADDFVKKYRESLERYTDAPVDIATLVLRPKSWNKTWRLSKAAAKIGQVLKYDEVSEIEAEKWLTGQAKKAFGVTLSPSAAGMLVDRLGSDLARLNAEVEKLAVTVGTGGAITEKEIDALTGRASDDDPWVIQEALLSGNPEKAVSTLRELIDLAKQPEQLITHFVADLVRKLHHASNMLSQGKREFDVCKEMRIWGDRQRPFMGAVRKLGAGKSARMLAGVIDMDRKAKSGFGKGDRLLERFCVAFCTSIR